MPRPQKNEESHADPNLAAFLTWFIPGAGHLYMGKGVFAICAFLVVEGLYWIGVQLSDGMTFQFLQEELRTRMAPALTPEVGNVGALIWQMKTYAYGPIPYFPTPFPATIKLGATLTALSGVLNAVLMVRAYSDAKFTTEERSRGLCPSLGVLAGFLVPGLGHWLQGRRFRGATVFILLVGLFALATVLAEGSNLDRERHFYYWAGQFMIGLPSMLAELVHGHPKVTGEIPYADAGVVIGCLAGLLNILALLDVYGYGEERLLQKEKAEARASATVEEEVATA